MRKTAMISSTAVDLPEHRKQAIDACLREGVFPNAMEHLPARDADAIRVSLEMVDKADIYVGIYAWRYGHIPDGHDISITEMEFNRALERKIPILVFLIHKDHAITIEMVEADKGAQEKLKRLKERASQGRGRLQFVSPVELRSHIIQSLSALLKEQEEASEEAPTLRLHPPNNIPTAPDPYIAHPYSLLQTTQVIGRQAELNLLTDWVTTNRHVPSNVRLFNIVAIGGMGKSALTWKWFNDIAPHELANRAGWLWWSFYESDAHYENLIIRALAYVSGQTERAVRELTAPEREDQLWSLLDEQPFVIVLDGLERILLAYSRMDAARMLDDDLDERTANRVANALGLPESAAQSFIGKHQLRLTADHYAGRFLRRLTSVRAARVLISTRLYPAELQMETGDPLPGCFAYFLAGLTDDDALNLWREFKVSGSREQLLPLFRSFGNYPLLLRALAGEVANFRGAPRNFDKWRAANPGFNPAGLPLKNAKTHVLEFALRSLGKTQRQVLHTLAAFRMPATWNTLSALLVQCTDQEKPLLAKASPQVANSVQSSNSAEETNRPCANDRALDLVLTELEDRGLVGWDKQANRYDLHPIVRGVVWATLAAEAKRGLYRELYDYFDAAPRPPKWEKVESIEDLTPAVELFDKLIGLERYEDAFDIFRDHLAKATYYRLSASRLRVELVERFFPDGIDVPPRLGESRRQSVMINWLALDYDTLGEPGKAALLYERAAEIDERGKDEISLVIGLSNFADALRLSGQLRRAERVGSTAIGICRKAKDRLLECRVFFILATTLAMRGESAGAKIVLRRNQALCALSQQHEGTALAALAQYHLWLRQPTEALKLAQHAWQLAHVERLPRDLIRAARLHGQAALGLSDLTTAEERLQHALTRARLVNLVEEEILGLSALAEFHRQRHQFGLSRELLEQVWAPAEHGPYTLFHSDACTILARVERDEMNKKEGEERGHHRVAAISAATRAYELAWCDGPPYAYHFGLTNAKELLAELGAPEPQLPPFDETKFEPMPVVELNPKDEVWVDPAKLNDNF